MTDDDRPFSVRWREEETRRHEAHRAVLVERVAALRLARAESVVAGVSVPDVAVEQLEQEIAELDREWAEGCAAWPQRMREARQMLAEARAAWVGRRADFDDPVFSAAVDGLVAEAERITGEAR